MQKIMLDILNTLNHYQGLAQWLTSLIATIALIYAIKEYFLKRRPYIDIEIEIGKNQDIKQGGWLFFAKLINKGNFPGVARVKKTEMRVGDETYPSEVKSKFILSPGENKKSALIGSIYKTGIDKIINHEYKSNRVEIEIEVASGELGSKTMKYHTKVIYEVNVRGDMPVLLLVNEESN